MSATIQKTALETKLLELFAARIEPRGFRAVDVDCKQGGRSLIRFFIEKTGGSEPEPGSLAVSLEDCAEVSRALDAALEETFEKVAEPGESPEIAQGPFSGPYDLEVSSPGLDRRLRLLPDFEKVVGKEVRLKLLEKKEPFGQNLQGRLVSVDAQRVVLDISKREAQVGLQEICRANLVWRPEEKGQKGPKKFSQKK